MIRITSSGWTDWRFGRTLAHSQLVLSKWLRVVCCVAIRNVRISAINVDLAISVDTLFVGDISMGAGVQNKFILAVH